MNPLISVIVPIYKIENYIGLCIESIISQSYQNLEIILVDDGSPDRCSEICNLYQKKDCRINVIHKENGGLVSARQAGLNASNGDYICYVDGDDWIDASFIDSLYTYVSSVDADVVCAGFTRDLFSKSERIYNCLHAGLYEGVFLIELWKHMISSNGFYRPGIHTYVWNKMFKRSIIKNPQASVDRSITIGEDAAVTYPSLINCKKVIICNNTDYHYRQREDSMLKQKAPYSEESIKLRTLYAYLNQWALNTNQNLRIMEQIDDYILANAIMRSGGRLPHDDYSTFDPVYFGKRVVVYNAGTFGQQLVNRFKETEHCKVVAWIDDDYWEYRRCCLDVDPVESVSSLDFDFLLIAKVDGIISEEVLNRLVGLGVTKDRILTVKAPNNKKQLIEKFLDVKAIKDEEERNIRVVTHV